MFSQIDAYWVGNDVFTIKRWDFPQHGETDFEVYDSKGEWIVSLVSKAPALGTSLVWKYLKGISDNRIYVTSSREV
jgi:hypothetical protein